MPCLFHMNMNNCVFMSDAQAHKMKSLFNVLQCTLPDSHTQPGTVVSLKALDEISTVFEWAVISLKLKSILCISQMFLRHANAAATKLQETCQSNLSLNDFTCNKGAAVQAHLWILQTGLSGPRDSMICSRQPSTCFKQTPTSTHIIAQAYAAAA